MYPLTPEQLDNYDEFIQEHRDDPGGGGGGGGGGTTNYNDLTNKPSINGTVLSGNKSLSALGIASAASVTEAATKADNAATKADAAAASASSALTVATAANEKAMEVAEVVETKADVNTLNAVAARVGVNETNIATLQDTTATHTSDIADLQSTDTALGTRIGTINTTIGSMDDLSPASDTLVEAINKAYNHGGDSGTTDYSDLDNKPSINDVTLEGNKTLAQLGVAAADDLTSLQEQVDGITVPTKTSELENDSNFVDTTELATKQDIMQVTTLPSASAAYEGKVYQLIPVGTFYRCVHNISDDLYVWEATDATITNAISTIQGDDTNSSMRQVAEDVVSTLPAAIVPRGTIAFADLPALADASVGDMYNISDDFTTTADFVTPNVDMTAGSNVYVIDNNGAKKWDVFYVTGAMDLSAYQTKALTATTFDSATVEAALTQAETEVDANATAISAINDVIPSTATSDNKLVTATEIDAKQNKALDTEVQIGDNECATVEEAINATAGIVPDTASSENKLATVSDALTETITFAGEQEFREWVMAHKDDRLFTELHKYKFKFSSNTEFSLPSWPNTRFTLYGNSTFTVKTANEYGSYMSVVASGSFNLRDTVRDTQLYPPGSYVDFIVNDSQTTCYLVRDTAAWVSSYNWYAYAKHMLYTDSSCSTFFYAQQMGKSSNIGSYEKNPRPGDMLVYIPAEGYSVAEKMGLGSKVTASGVELPALAIFRNDDAHTLLSAISVKNVNSTDAVLAQKVADEFEDPGNGYLASNMGLLWE